MIALGLVLALAFGDNDARLTPIAVTASSTLAGTEAGMLVDGKLDTSWQADAQGAFGVGQWVRLDFGRVVDVTRIEVDSGVQRVEGGVDRFCAEARASFLGMIGETGRGVWFDTLETYGRRGIARAGQPGFAKPLRTRVLTIVIEGVQTGYERPGAVGLAEIAVWGREAPAHAVESGQVTCGSTRMAALRDAVIEHCAATYRTTRPTAECQLWWMQFEYCANAPPPWMPITEADYGAPTLALEMENPNPPFPTMKARFERVGERWRVGALSCSYGKKACGLRHTVFSDSQEQDTEVVTRPQCRTVEGKYVHPPKP